MLQSAIGNLSAVASAKADPHYASTCRWPDSNRHGPFTATPRLLCKQARKSSWIKFVIPAPHAKSCRNRMFVRRHPCGGVQCIFVSETLRQIAKDLASGSYLGDYTRNPTGKSRNSGTRTPDDYRAMTSTFFRLTPSATFTLFLRSLMTKVLFSPRVDHGPRVTSLKSTNLQSDTSVSLKPR